MPVFDIWGTYEIQQVKKRTWPSLITNKFAKQTKRQPVRFVGLLWLKVLFADLL
jgi:hypothetical protein